MRPGFKRKLLDKRQRNVTNFIWDGSRALLRLKFRLDRGVRDLDILGQRPRR